MSLKETGREGLGGRQGFSNEHAIVFDKPEKIDISSFKVGICGNKGQKVGTLEKPYFRGQSVHRLDAKGRLRIPNKFREVLQSNYKDALIITVMNKCLVAYPPEGWEEIEAKVQDFSQVQPDQRAFMRHFVSSAEECEFDNQGRILIPPFLRESAGLEQEVLLAGMLKNFEIWDKTAWEQHRDWCRDNFPQIVEKIAITGL
jgi:MraZ protein